MVDAQGQVQDVVEGLDPYVSYRVEGHLSQREEP
jgi:hypothetical protein